jgi:hypothetical protein
MTIRSSQTHGRQSLAAEKAASPWRRKGFFWVRRSRVTTWVRLVSALGGPCGCGHRCSLSFAWCGMAEHSRMRNQERATRQFYLFRLYDDLICRSFRR